nr:hypothetical protein BaRGS_004871 [Batillaria attramentaria]
MAEKEEGVPLAEEREMDEGSHSSGADESSSEEMDEGELFEVEKIVSKKKLKGKTLYKVRWKGYPPSNDTWEPVDNLGQVLDMVEEFDEQEEAKKRQRQEERRIQKLKMEGKLLPGEESPDSDDELYGLRDPFWKRLEMGQLDLTCKPDMYSTVKSRKVKKGAASASGTTPQPEQKEKRRGRGRGRGSSTGRGRGRARGRPKKSRDDDSCSSSETSSWRSAKSKDRGKKSKGRTRRRPGRRRLSSSEETSGSYSLADSDTSNISDISITSPQSGRRVGKRPLPKTGDSPVLKTSSPAAVTPALSPRVSLDSLEVSDLPSAKALSPTGTAGSDGEQETKETGLPETSPEACSSQSVCEVKEKPTLEIPKSKSSSELTQEDLSAPSKQKSKKGKKKSSRKRKPEDTVVVHAEAVSSGDASPPKMSPSPGASSPAALSPAHREVQRRSQEVMELNSGVDESSQEPRLTIDLSAGGSESEDTSLPEAPPVSARRNTPEKKVPPLVIPLTKLQGCESQVSVTKHKLPVQLVTPAAPPRARTAEANRLPAGTGSKIPTPSSVPSISVKKESPAQALSPAQEKSRSEAGDIRRRLSSSSSRESFHTATAAKDFTQAAASATVKDAHSVTNRESTYPNTSAGLGRDVTSRDATYQSSSFSTVRDVSQYSATSGSGTSLSKDAQASASSYRDQGLFSRFEVKSVAPVVKQAVPTVLSGKENTNRQASVRPGPSFPKKKDMDGSQPLDAISDTSVFAGDIQRASKLRGLDSDFEIALEKMDLADIESILLPEVEPIELSDDSLKLAVQEGNAQLVERALAAEKKYNIDMVDQSGRTMLMHAVLGGYDDIIVQLLFHNANVQLAQKDGATALMMAVESAECSTVALLLEMGANINAKDHSGETALMKAVKRGDKQILKLLLENGSNFTAVTATGYNAIQLAKFHRLADVETTLVDHISRVTVEFEKQVRATLKNTATLIAPLFPHQCFPVYESERNIVRFKYQPSAPAGPGMGFLLFIAHARINSNEVKCRLYGHCAVTSVYLNDVLQPSLTEESNFVLMCHPLFEGYNELVVNINKDTTSKAKLIVCGYKAQLVNPDRQ